MNKAKYEWYKSQGICPQCKVAKVEYRVVCENCQKKAYEKKKIRLQHRKDTGLCLNCGKPSENTYCDDCKKVNADKMRDLRHYRKSLGVCVNCGKSKAVRGETLCLVCKMDKRDSSRGRVRKYDAEAEMSRYYLRKEQGLCTSCGKRSQERGLLCRACYSKRLIRKDKKKKDICRCERPSHNKCYICGNTLDIKDIKVCSSCYSQRLKAMSGIMYMSKEEKNASYWDGLNTLASNKIN